MTTESDIQTTAPVIPPVRLAVDGLAPRISKAMNSLEAASRYISLEATLVELVSAL